MTEAEDRVKYNVDALERSVDGYLNVLEQQGKWWGWKNQTFKGMVIPYGVWHAAAQEGPYKLIGADRARSMQTGRPGSPDRVGIFRHEERVGVFVAIELKTGSARMTAEQMLAKEIVKRLGGIHILANTVEDVENALVPSRFRQMMRDADAKALDVSDIPF